MGRSRGKPSKSSVPSKILDLVNQVFDIEKKASRIDEENSIERSVNNIKDIFENELLKDAKITYENPIGEEYDETRTDCEASIAGESSSNLIITEVIKPIIHIRKGGVNKIEQKGVVIVESQDNKSKDE
jgi:hypothetical protein